MLRSLLGIVGIATGGFLVASAAAAGADGDSTGGAAAPVAAAEVNAVPPIDFPNIRLFRGYAWNGPAAVNPVDPRYLAVGIGFLGHDQCYVKHSADGGKTWSLVQLPKLASRSADLYCRWSAPAVTFAADGSRLYAAYVPTGASSFLTGPILLSISLDQGRSWSAPTATPLGQGDVDDVVISLAAAPEGRRLYLAASSTTADHRVQSLRFSSSGDQGKTWTDPRTISTDDPYDNISLLGFSLAAGNKGNVLIAYGWREYYPKPSFTVRIARSADQGATFATGIAAQSGTLQLSTPDIRIGPAGTAHLVYTRGPDYPPGGEAVLYKFSSPPYATWSAAAARLDDGDSGVTRSSAHIAAGTCGRTSVLHTTWLENRTGGGAVLYTRKLAQTGHVWSPPLPVGAAAAALDRNSIAAAGPKAFTVWQTRPAAADDWAIVGSRINSGVACP